MKFWKNRKNKKLTGGTECGTRFSNEEKENTTEQICQIEKKEKGIKKLENEKTKSVQLEIEEANIEDNEKLEEAEEAVKKQSTKKKKWTSLISLLINIGVVAGILTYQLSNENGMAPLSDLVSRLNWGVVVLLIVVFILVNFFEMARFWILTYKTTGKNRPGLAYKLGALGRYYDNITPFAAGEQPFQMHYLSKRGASSADAVSIPMGKYVISQIAFVTFTFIIMIFSISMKGFSNAGAVVVTAGSWIGFAINSALVFFIGLLSVNRKIGTKLMTGILKLLHKMRIVKDYDKTYKKIIHLVNDYQSTMRKYVKNKWSFIGVLFSSYLVSFFHYTIPFLIHAAFFGFDFSVFSSIFIYCVMIDLTASFLPLPGGTGAAELSFTAIFGLYFVDGTIFWAMIIWRIFTFYSYIVQGLLILVYDYLVGNRKFQWEKKKWALEAESRTFEDNHLKEFETSLENSRKVKNRRSRKK